MPHVDQTITLPKFSDLKPDRNGDAVTVSHQYLHAQAPVVDVTSEDRGRANVVLAWVLPSALMLVLGLIRLSWPSLWSDELATWGMATATWDQFLPVLSKIDAVLAPYYAIAWAVAKVFGASEFALRLPSVLAMAVAVGLTSRIGSRLGGARVGLIAGLVMALLPTSSRFAQEARPYAFAVMATALATLALLRLIERPTACRSCAYVGSVILIGLFHNVALMVLLAHGLWLLISHRNVLWRWSVATTIAVAALSPLLWLGHKQQKQIAWIPDPTLDRVLKLPEGVFGTALIAGIVLTLFLIGFSFRNPAVGPTLWAISPVAGIYAVSQITSMLLPRYLMFTIPGWAIIAGIALSRGPVLRGVIAVMAIGALGISTQSAVRSQSGHSQGSRDVGALLASMAQPGDVAIYGPDARDESRIGRDLVTKYVPLESRPTDALLATPARTQGNFRPIECTSVTECFGDPSRVWVIRVGTYHNPLSQLGSAKETLLASEYSVQTVWHPAGLTIALLIKKAVE